MSDLTFFKRPLRFVGPFPTLSPWIEGFRYESEDGWTVETEMNGRVQARRVPWSAALSYRGGNGVLVHLVASGNAATEAGALKALERRTRQWWREAQGKADQLKRAIDGGAP
jgi:hypothetical protein